MSHADPHAITTTEELRDPIGDVKSGFDLKVVDRSGRLDQWGERHRVSFGEIYAAGNQDAARTIEKAIAEDDWDNL